MPIAVANSQSPDSPISRIATTTSPFSSPASSPPRAMPRSRGPRIRNLFNGDRIAVAAIGKECDLAVGHRAQRASGQLDQFARGGALIGFRRHALDKTAAAEHDHRLVGDGFSSSSMTISSNESTISVWRGSAYASRTSRSSRLMTFISFLSLARIPFRLAIRFSISSYSLRSATALRGSSAAAGACRGLPAPELRSAQSAPSAFRAPPSASCCRG